MEPLNKNSNILLSEFEDDVKTIALRLAQRIDRIKSFILPCPFNNGMLEELIELRRLIVPKIIYLQRAVMIDIELLEFEQQYKKLLLMAQQALFNASRFILCINDMICRIEFGQSVNDVHKLHGKQCDIKHKLNFFCLGCHSEIDDTKEYTNIETQVEECDFDCPATASGANHLIEIPSNVSPSFSISSAELVDNAVTNENTENSSDNTKIEKDPFASKTKIKRHRKRRKSETDSNCSIGKPTLNKTQLPLHSFSVPPPHRSSFGTTPMYGQLPPPQYNNLLPTQQYSSLPTQQYSSLPTQQYSSLPTPQYSSLPTPQYSLLPTPQYSSLPTQQYSSLPTSQYGSLLPTSQYCSLLPTSQYGQFRQVPTHSYCLLPKHDNHHMSCFSFKQLPQYANEHNIQLPFRYQVNDLLNLIQNRNLGPCQQCCLRLQYSQIMDPDYMSYV